MRRNTLQVKAIDRFTGSQRGLYRKASKGTIGVDAVIVWEYLANPDEKDVNKQEWKEAKNEQEASVLANKEIEL